MKLKLFAVLAALAATLSLAAPASAQVYSFAATLTGASETPPVATNAGGSALVSFDAGANTVSVMEWFFDLATPATASHIHCCTTTPLTGTAPVALGFTGFPSATTGTYSNTFTLSAASFTSLLNGSLAGKSYVNIHNATYPGGEIQGFLHLVAVAVPEPGTYALMLAGVAVIGWAARRRRHES